MKNIVLIGMMGSGKSSVGKRLAHNLDRPFVDTDSLIEQRESRSIPEIFELYGENYFRKLERDIVREISESDNLVIATGGGIVINSENVHNLKQRGEVFYLRNGIDALEKRLSENTEGRPLLNGQELRATLEKLLEKRESLYIESADRVIDNDDLEATVNLIKRLVNEEMEESS